MSVIDDAVSWAVDIANDDTHGYDQTHRWGPDYDCSSFVISAWEEAGVDVKANGASSTHNMCAAFLKSGFTDVTNQVDIVSGSGLEAGDVLWVKGHTCMYVGDNQVANASHNEHGHITGGQTGDQTGKEIDVQPYYNKKWTKILRYTG